MQFMLCRPRHSITQAWSNLNSFVCNWVVNMLLKEILNWTNMRGYPSHTIFQCAKETPPDRCFALLTDIDSGSSITFKVSSFDKIPIYVELLPCWVIRTPGLTTRTTNSYSFAFHAYLCWLAAVQMTWRENCPMFPGASNSCGSWMVRPKSRTNIVPVVGICLNPKLSAVAPVPE